jgi:hypothetical protein
MAGPSPAFLAQLNAGLAPDPFAAGAAAAGIAPPGAPPPTPPVPGDAMLYGASSTGAPPIRLPGVPAPPPEATGAEAPPPPGAPANVPAGLPASPPNSPSLPANPGDVEFAPVTSGGQPAREVPVRGPRQNAFLERSFEGPMDAAESVGRRSSEQADQERSMYERQAEQYEEQQAAMMRVQARREQELRQLRQNYMQTIDSLSTMSIDNGRLWNNSTTMDKIGATLLITLGAALGGSNSATIKAVQKRVEDDVENQKRAYEMGLNLAKGQQSAFAMAMDQFGSEDAAYHAAMASGQQAVASKIAGMGAQWKGTEAKNKADSLMGEIMHAADQSRANGLKYLQPTPGANKYQMTIRGQRVPGLVSEDRAQGYAVEHGVKPAEKIDEKAFEGGITLAGKRMEVAGKHMDKTGDETKFIASELQKAKVPELRSATERILKLLNKSPGGPGEAFVRGATPGQSADWLLGEDRNAREQEWNAFANKAINILSGAAVSPSEMARLEKQLGSASNPESRRRAVEAVLATTNDVEKNILRGVSEEGERRYKSRGETASPGDPIAPKGITTGWGK